MSATKENTPNTETDTPVDFIIDKSYRTAAIAYSFRVSTLVLHYTVDSFEQALYKLTGQDPNHLVSAHYLVADKIQGKAQSYIYQLVDENDRAWHAGLGFWGRSNDLNTTSIGIEIVNLDGNKYPYPEEQINAVIQLAKAIVAKYDIDPTHVIGHSDLAPTRKIDPGTMFPWERLYENGVGAWPDKSDVAEYMHLAIPSVSAIQSLYCLYGYGIEMPDSELGKTSSFTEAFQRHFRASRVDGVVDQETYAILRALLKKYKSFP